LSLPRDPENIAAPRITILLRNKSNAALPRSEGFEFLIASIDGQTCCKKVTNRRFFWRLASERGLGFNSVRRSGLSPSDRAPKALLSGMIPKNLQLFGITL
jgi:hypothetical protein